VQLASAAHDARIRRAAGIGRRSLLQVIDVLDLRVCAEAVVVAAEVGLAVRQEDGLVLRAPE
jgi:hypothetical protein